MVIELIKDPRFLRVNEILDELKKEYNLEKEDILILAEEIKIPLSLFSSGLSSFELIVKYLYQEKKFPIMTIARLTQRSKQGVYQALKNAIRKCPEQIKIVFSKYDFPISIISDKNYSILESIVKYLKETFSLSYAEIAKPLNRDQRTIWTVYSRAKNK